MKELQIITHLHNSVIILFASSLINTINAFTANDCSICCNMRESKSVKTFQSNYLVKSGKRFVCVYAYQHEKIGVRAMNNSTAAVYMILKITMPLLDSVKTIFFCCTTINYSTSHTLYYFTL